MFDDVENLMHALVDACMLARVFFVDQNEVHRFWRYCNMLHAANDSVKSSPLQPLRHERCRGNWMHELRAAGFATLSGSAFEPSKPGTVQRLIRRSSARLHHPQ